MQISIFIVWKPAGSSTECQLYALLRQMCITTRNNMSNALAKPDCLKYTFQHNEFVFFDLVWKQTCNRQPYQCRNIRPQLVLTSNSCGRCIVAISKWRHPSPSVKYTQDLFNARTLNITCWLYKSTLIFFSNINNLYLRNKCMHWMFSRTTTQIILPHHAAEEGWD